MAGYYFEVLEAVGEPEVIYAGKAAEHIMVLYKESGTEDGFVITVFLTRRTKQLERRQKIWGS